MKDEGFERTDRGWASALLVVTVLVIGLSMLDPVGLAGLVPGRLHPALAHFPIGFLTVAALLAWRGGAEALRWALWAALPAALLTALAGLSAATEGFERATPGLVWHQRSAWVTLATLAAVGWWAKRGIRRGVRLGLVGAWIACLVSGYLGGRLAHGSILGGGAPAGPGVELAVEAGIYPGVVRPLLDRYCTECHGPINQRGALRLDDLERLRAGGQGGPVVHPGEPADSPLVGRLLLPPGDEHHMPPANRPQPSPGEVELLRFWVASGAEDPGPNPAPGSLAWWALQPPDTDDSR